uniref:Uncharacterized protein n=1 Tax=Heterorhabditis bacteriophora TaxID=37862 RepID=A0A1I7WL71_HETBA
MKDYGTELLFYTNYLLGNRYSLLVFIIVRDILDLLNMLYIYYFAFKLILLQFKVII